MKLRLSGSQRQRLHRLARRERDAETRQRYVIVLLLARGKCPSEIHRILGCARSTVYRVAKRFLEWGIRGLRSRRGEGARRKVTRRYLRRLRKLLHMSPRELGWQRSTWTRELLAIRLEMDTGIKLHPTHVGRLLRMLSVRWGRPRPVPPGYMSKAAKKRQVDKILKPLQDVADDEVVLYVDEVDIHLNPKIGPCWMPKGVQFEVETPGTNEKRYLFGGLDSKTGELVWMASCRKNSQAFVEWLELVCEKYRHCRRIHIICDNYIIHKSKKTQAAIERLSCVELHFLPPYSPEYNKIETLWRQLHAVVTRNHKHKTMEELMAAVEHFMITAAPYPGSRPSLARAA